MNNIFISLKNLFNNVKEKKVLKSFIVILLIVLTLLLLVLSLQGTKKSENYSDYVSYMENKLSVMLNNIDGAGKVDVAIYVSGGMETVLAMKKTVKESGNTKETEETPIILNGKTVTLKEMYPKIESVLVISEGADNISVRRKLQQACLMMLDVDINNIEILKRK